MDLRKDLTDLVCDAAQIHGCIHSCNHPPCAMVGGIVDALIANGVTILKWSLVTDGLPTDSEKCESYLVKVCESHWPTSSYDPCDAPYSTEYVDVARYDSDQKLWYIGSPDITLNALLMPDNAPLNGMCVLAWAEMPSAEVGA